ncbi:NADH-quinone oxidoreductase subunit NuoN [Parasphingopyxis marina]|uniref:NADH-quinone oxidoreductase subunit N n=1 Tax=Parasphingopyxis marina TaxID=2761622 RepID=A0A842I1F2_9SPHN|nr:NADH-quinone oxidoreductase subunit NuoN [Parasphingopyxis marina]MBC2777594.1 NADH-quinone oxidoreductase subunit NuoN [Parasphingopyxis marina]
MSYLDNLVIVAPELILTITSLLALLLAAWSGRSGYEAVSVVCLFGLLVAGLSLVGAAGDGGPVFGGLYFADDFSTFSKVLIYAAAAVSILMAPRFFASDGLRAEYPILIVFAALGMGFMVSSGDLMTLYIGLEMQSLAAYVLASFMRQDTRSAEAGLKYFVLGALASGILLYGVSLLYGFTGTTSYRGIAVAMQAGLSTGELFGLVFVLAGLAFKISAVPFHMWTPDVYEGAPTPVTAFFASAPKVAAVALSIRVVIDAMGPATGEWQQIVIFVALASIALGAVAAIGQSNIKRLLAYSSINNIGFALIGLAAGTVEGVAATMSYMAIYVVMTLGSFLCVLQMRDAEGRPVEDIESLAGLSKTQPALAAAFAIFMFSLAGIPPLLGFWGKFLVFDAAVSAGLFPLAVIGIALSVIGAYYYLRIVKTIYFDDSAPAYAPANSMVENGLIAVAAAAVSPLGYLLVPFLALTAGNAARALF